MSRHVHYSPPPPLPLFDAAQEQELARVSGAISKAILGFLRARLNNGYTEFHAAELRDWVAASVATAPASADRVMRDLRKTGRIAYHVVNRARSLYRIDAVA